MWYACCVARPNPRSDALASAFLVCLVAKLAHGIGAVRDLPTSDEAGYAASGLRLLASVKSHAPPAWPAPSWGPLYAAWYAGIAAFCPASEEVFDVQWTSMVLALTLAFYALGRRRGLGPLASMLLAGAPLATNFFHMQPMPNHLALLFLLVACICAVGAREWIAKLAALFLATLGGAFVRPELAVVAFPLGAAVGGLAVHRVVKRQGGSERATALALSSFAAAAALVMVLGNPLGGTRSFEAFSQHYGFTATRREHLPGNPWVNFEWIVRRDFGAVGSMRQAVLANPGALLRHALYNLGELPSNVLDLCMLRRSVTAPTPVAWQGASAVALCAALIALAASVRRALRGRGSEREGPAVTLLVLAFGVAVAAETPGVLLVFPRAHYLVAPCALAWLLAGGELEKAIMARAAVLRPIPRAAAIAVACAALWLLVPAARGSAPSPQPVRAAVRAVRALELSPATVFDASSEILALAGYGGFPTINGWSKSEPFDALLARHDVGIVVLTDGMLAREAYARDPSVASFVSDPVPFGLSRVYVDPGFVQVFARPGLIRAGR
jgi:hypothetical protein